MKSRLLFFFFICPFLVFSQQEEAEQYTSETLFGVNFHTNGGAVGGLTARRSKKIEEKEAFYLYSLDAVHVRHPEEVSVESIRSGKNYLLDKLNYLFVVRPSMGLEKMVFPPAKVEGVQVNGMVMGGLSIGIVKPYYIRYDYSQNGTFVQQEPFNPVKTGDPNKIMGHGNVFSGFLESKIVPGFHLKTSVSFYFGSYGKRFSGLEAGALVEGFFNVGGGNTWISTYRVPILAGTKNPWFFTAFYLNLFYGWRK